MLMMKVSSTLNIIRSSWANILQLRKAMGSGCHFIRRARDLGFSLEAVRELLALSDDTGQSCEAVDIIASSHLAEVKRKVQDLSALRSELERVIGSCRHGTIDDCKIIEALAPRAVN